MAEKLYEKNCVLELSNSVDNYLERVRVLRVSEDSSEYTLMVLVRRDERNSLCRN